MEIVERAAFRRHPRRRHRDLGRRRRPARGGRDRAAASAASARSCGWRSRARSRARCSRGSRSGSPSRPDAGLPDPRPARPRRRLPALRARPAGSQVRAVGRRTRSGASRRRRTATCSRRSRAATSSSSTRTTRSRRASRRSCAQRRATRHVVTLKTTVYRTSHDSALAPALIEAAENGKQSVCLVELKARFDERRNIEWARSLEQAGVHVVYGFPDLKIHAKTTLVVRREGDGLRRYVHIGTGNYHATTARIYEDVGLFTADPDIAADVADLFNFVTGFGRPQRFRKMLVAPFNLRKRARRAHPRGRAAAAAGEHARIRIKVQQPHRPGDRRGALPRLAGRRRDRPRSCARSARCGPGVDGLSETDPRALDPRPLPRAQPALLLRGGRREDVPARQRRPDAAQPRPPDRGRRARSRRRTCAPRSSRSSRRCWPTTPRRGSCAPDGAWERVAPEKSERRRSAQATFMRRRDRARRLARPR